MTGHAGKATRRSKSDGVSAAAQSERRDAYTRLPGQIVSFDPSTQTATVQIMYRPLVNGEPIDPPLLEGVPVNQPRGGGFAMTAPIRSGDYVDLSFDDFDTSAFREGGSASAPTTQRMNSLSDAIATPGGYPSSSAMGGYDPDNMFVGTEDHANGLRVSPDGKVAIEGAGGAQDLVTIIHELLDVLSNEQTVVSYGSSRGNHDLKSQGDFAALKARVAAMKLR